MWETEKAKEAEKISDLVKARELLLNSKVELQRSLDECKVDLERLQTSHKDALDKNQDLIRNHSKAIDDLKLHHVSLKFLLQAGAVEQGGGAGVRQFNFRIITSVP